MTRMLVQLGLALFLLAAGIWFKQKHFLEKPHHLDRADPVLSQTHFPETHSSPYSVPKQEIVLPNAKPKNPGRSSWDHFKQVYGENLQAEFSAQGKLIAVRGKVGLGQKPKTDFDPTQSEQVLSRSREILAHASDLLGMDSLDEMQPITPVMGPLSAHVDFQQTFHQVPLMPLGSIRVDLGSQGELLGLYSNYVPNLHITNEVKLTSEEAKAKVQAKSGGAQIIWTEGAEGKYAYLFYSNGIRTVVDAATGEVLSQRSQRHT